MSTSTSNGEKPRLMRRLLTFARPHAKGFILSSSLLLIVAVVSLSVPKIVGRGVTQFMAPEGDDLLSDTARVDGLWQTGWILVGIAMLVFALRFSQVLITARTGQKVIHDLRMTVFRHIIGRSLRFFDRQPVGTLVTRVNGDIETLNEFFVSGIDVLLYDLVRILFIVILLFTVDWQMALAALVIVPFILGWAFVFQRRTRSLFREVRGRVSEAAAWTNEALSGVRVAQAFAREEAVVARFQSVNDKLMHAHLKTVRNFSWFFPGMETLSALGQSLVLVTGYYLVKGDRIEIGSVVETWLYLSMFIEPLRQLADKYNILQAAVASGERVFQVLDDKTALPEAANAERPSQQAGRLRFENVRFHYDERKPVLNGVSFTAEPGETVAIVGPTGSGKSTLMALLSRFYDPTDGRILLDDQDLRALDLSWLRRRVGVVLQDVFLFEGTVRENLTLGDSDLTDAQLTRALEAVQADRIVQRLGGLEGRLAERGAGLSLGEKQLLAFARTLAHDPLVLILDEATAHIDSETELLLRRALETLTEGRTSLVIAHRLSTVTSADQILVLANGCVKEEGRHEELLAANGFYARLYRLQFEKGDEA